MSKTFAKASETLQEALQKLCFFNGTGGFKRLSYRVIRGKFVTCEDCRYRGACFQKTENACKNDIKLV